MLFTYAINLWHRKFVTADVTAVFVNNQHGIQQRGQDFDLKSLYLKGYTAKTLTNEFPEKSRTKRGVNKLLKSCGTQAQCKAVIGLATFSTRIVIYLTFIRRAGTLS